MGELICCRLSVKSAAWILLTLGAAFSSNLVLAQVRSPIFSYCEVRDSTFGRTIAGCCDSVTMLELSSLLTKVSVGLLSLLMIYVSAWFTLRRLS